LLKLLPPGRENKNIPGPVSLTCRGEKEKKMEKMEKIIETKEELEILFKEIEEFEEKTEKLIKKMEKTCSGRTEPGTIIKKELFDIKAEKECFDITFKNFRNLNIKTIRVRFKDDILFSSEDINDEDISIEDIEEGLVIDLDPEKVDINKLAENIIVEIEPG
jgi:hypothetical protein